MSQCCAQSGCQNAPSSSCSVCAREHYCGSICQKLDWKKHKSICPILKTFSNKLQPYREVDRVILDILGSKEGHNVRVLEHLLLYAEYQFGKQIPGTQYREKRDGVRISNWMVEIFLLPAIYTHILEYYIENHSLSKLFKRDKMEFYLEISLNLLNPWLILIDSDASDQGGIYDDYHKNLVLVYLGTFERNMAIVALDKRQFEAAEGHNQRCLAYSKRLTLEGEEKTTPIFHALRTFCQLREHQGNFSDALIFAEEGYNLVVEAYDCSHPEVQEAAGILINILIMKGDLFDAERYAQVTYGNLRDKKNGMNQEGLEVARGAYNLAKVLLKQLGLGYVPHVLIPNDKLSKAEEAARNGLRIIILSRGSDHLDVCEYSDLLARILQEQNKLGDETRMLYERCLSLAIRKEGPDELNTGIYNQNSGGFYFKLGLNESVAEPKRAHFLKSKFYYDEAVRIHAKVYGPTHPITLKMSLSVDIIKEQLSLFVWTNT